jgi:anti-sigma factor RsiW
VNKKMFSQHVGRHLSAYCHGELSLTESRRVAEHLIGCQSCRREFEEIKLGVKFAEQLPRASAPASLWSEIEAASLANTRAVSSRQGLRRFIPQFGWSPAVAACALLLLALTIGSIWYLTRPTREASPVAKQGTPREVSVPGRSASVDSNTLQPSSEDNAPVASNGAKNGADAAPLKNGGATWEVARVAGAPRVGAERIEGNGQIAVGQWLETDNQSRAKINVADIGQVDIGPNSRVRLVGTRSTEHRLSLERGQLHAMISAPPRLFIVETPSSTAIDLGCSYTLEVDDAGRTILQVTTGWVALERQGRESIVPAGAVCVTQPGKGLGTPYFDDASPRFQAALSKLDFQNGGAQALAIVLAEAREYDTLTLWHLFPRVRGAERGRVYDRMAALIAPPQGITREGVLKLDKGMLDLWKKELEWAWFE